jgi:hypothetical protein
MQKKAVFDEINEHRRRSDDFSAIQARRNSKREPKMALGDSWPFPAAFGQFLRSMSHLWKLRWVDNVSCAPSMLTAKTGFDEVSRDVNVPDIASELGSILVPERAQPENLPGNHALICHCCS